MTNSNAIIAQSGHTRSAAALAEAHAGGGFTDWYLPSVSEMNEIIKNKFTLHEVLGDTDGLQSLYWTSTEVSSTNAYYIVVASNVLASTSKANTQFGGSNLETRAVRKITL